MPTVIFDPPPAELEALVERRRRLGLDRRDEVWEGVLHIIPAPSHEHERLVIDLGALLKPHANAAALEVTGAIALGVGKDDYRAPDLALHRPGAAAQWHPTAALAVEIVSPGDATWEKLPFYAAHQVDQLLIIDPQERTVSWLGLREGEYQPVERSGLIELGPAALAEQIDWP